MKHKINKVDKRRALGSGRMICSKKPHKVLVVNGSEPVIVMHKEKYPGIVVRHDFHSATEPLENVEGIKLELLKKGEASTANLSGNTEQSVDLVIDAFKSMKYGPSQDAHITVIGDIKNKGFNDLVSAALKAKKAGRVAHINVEPRLKDKLNRTFTTVIKPDVGVVYQRPRHVDGRDLRLLEDTINYK